MLTEVTNSKDMYNQRPRNKCQLDPPEDLRVLWSPAILTRKYLSEQSQVGDYLDVYA